MADEERSSLLARSMSHALDELRGFRAWLRWLCVDQSNYWTATLSWLVFLGLAIVVPALSHFVLACAADCVDSRHGRPYDAVAQLSLSAVAALSFVCLSGFVRRYGLRRFLFFDKLCDESEIVRKGYTKQFNVCSVSLLTGLLIILRSATRITHKAQAVTCLAAKWHVCATIDSFDTTEIETPVARLADEQFFTGSSDGSSDLDDVGDEEDELDNTRFIPSYAHSTISFQKRQALVTYFENNRAGITIYGFMLDRTSLHTIFGIEMSLVLWLLGKTIGIS